uniref:Reticulon n=1 Tax=Salarias fasciatus TaxID=181472 RepID=A0A672FGI0_SALFA
GNHSKGSAEVTSSQHWPPPKISAALQLVQWKEPKKSAAAFGMSMLVLVSVATLSVISVVSYLLLACLCVTITFRVYKSVIQAIQKSDEGHPFRSLLQRDISVSSESIRQLADQTLIHLNWFTCQGRRLLLVEDLVDSLKLAAVMWVMTYIGAVFNGVTILIIADVISFTTPLIYQKKKWSKQEWMKRIWSKQKWPNRIWSKQKWSKQKLPKRKQTLQQHGQPMQ